jgi:site-specific recombinase XerD
MPESLFDAAGRPSFASHDAGIPRRSTAAGQRRSLPADPPTVEEIVAVMRAAGESAHGRRMRALVVVLSRAGLRIHEALALSEAGLDRRRGCAARPPWQRRPRAAAAGLDEWACEQLQPWTALRLELPVGPLLCVITGPTRGRPWSSAAARSDLRRTAAAVGVRRRFAAPQLRHAHAVEMAHEGVPLIVIRCQLGHSNLGITSIYLHGHRQRRDHRHRPRPPSTDDRSPRCAGSVRREATTAAARRVGRCAR